MGCWLQAGGQGRVIRAGPEPVKPALLSTTSWEDGACSSSTAGWLDPRDWLCFSPWRLALTDLKEEHVVGARDAETSSWALERLASEGLPGAPRATAEAPDSAQPLWILRS